MNQYQAVENMSYSTKVIHTLSLLTAVCAMLLAGPLHAKCSNEARDEAEKLRALAAAESDTDEAIFLLRTSAQICENFTTWIDLGRLESNRGASGVAADYFSRATDMYAADENGELSTGKLRRLGTANTLLATALFENNKTADALQALEAAKRYFAAYRKDQPLRVIQLQASIDDAMSSASAPTLTRSLTLQRSGSTRGVGIRQKVEETSDEFVSEDAVMLAEENLDELVDDQPILVAQAEDTSISSADASEESESEITQNVAQISTDESDVANPSTTAQDTSATDTPASSRLNIQVLFKFDSAEIDSTGELQVQKIADALNALNLPANTPVQIIGHTDIKGNADYNLSLSERRATSVSMRLRNQVDNIVLSPVGMGETDVRYPGTTSDDHRRNRRVEIVIN